MNRTKHEGLAMLTHQASVPAFLLKLRNLLDDSENEHLISWDESGESFHLHDQIRFAKEVLPKYFKHNNLASFVRQLNMYGFKKISTIDNGSMQPREDMEFQNPYFIRDSPDLMESIKRKGSIREKLTTEYGALKPAQVSDVLVDVKELRNSQSNINQQLDVIKRENSVLWREIASLRQKHVQQQHIINKLIHFLMTMAGSRRNLKRKLPMIEVGPSKKMADPVLPYASGDAGAAASVSGSGNGVTIQEVTDGGLTDPIPATVEILPPYAALGVDDSEDSESADVLVQSPNSTMTSTAPAIMSSLTGPAIPSPAYIDPIVSLAATPTTTDSSIADATAAITSHPSNVVMIPPSPDLSDFRLNLSDSVDGIQSDIDILKDLFSNDTFGLPQDTVSSLFDDSGYNLSEPIGSEAQMYDLNDLMQNSSSDKKQQFLTDVSEQLPDELNSLIKGVSTPDENSLTEPNLEALLNENQRTTDHQPIISSHELD